MGRIDQTSLKLELLRARASIERAELRAAVLDLKSTTQPLRRLLGMVSGVAQVAEGRRAGMVSLAGTVFALLRQRPALLSVLVAIVSRRRARRWLALGAVAALVAWFVRGVVASSKAEGGSPGQAEAAGSGNAPTAASP
jgi:hypothetical protein